jgi:peptidoglycan/LPS O-acetylase OafA/YrhL
VEHRRDIDGLRGLAVLAVVLFHARFSLFQGGFVGVDVFFVISGYLITSIISKDLEDRSFTLAQFYERRVRRILPALIVTVVATWILAYWQYMPPEFKDYSASVASTSVFGSNILFWWQGGYFEGPTEIKPLLNLWSLAVEEQFYLFFPLTMLFLSRFRPSHRQFAIASVLLFSFTLSVARTAEDPEGAFYLTSTRAWELMIGALLAIDGWRVVPKRVVAELEAIAGLGMLAWAFWGFSSRTHFPGVSAAVPCLGAALLIHSGMNHHTWVRRALVFRPLVFIGLISYSLYLFHWPLLAFARYYWIALLPVHITVGVIILAIAAAAFSWRYIEQPFRCRTRFRRRDLFIGATVASALLMATGVLGAAKEGFPSRFPGYAHMNIRGNLPAYNIETCFLGWRQPVSEWRGQECFLTSLGKPPVLLWGDSFSAHLVPGFKANSSLLEYDVLQYSVSGCAPIVGGESTWRGGCRAAADQALAIAKKYGVTGVILAANWNEELTHYGDGYAGIRRTAEVLKSMGKEVVIIGQTPVFAFWDSLDVQYRLTATHRPTSNYYRFLRVGGEFSHEFKQELSGIPIIDPMDVLCRPQSCQVTANTEPLYIDGAHLSVAGSTILLRSIAAGLNQPLNGTD